MTVQAPDWSAAKEAYDAIAQRYDRIPEENSVNRLLRARSLERLRAAFRPGQLVLELGCGTGDEALDLASHGVRVVAVDPSTEMVRLARSKADARGLGDGATFRQASARGIGALGLDSESFDGAYASFSLAYEPDLRPVATALHRLLRPDALLLSSVPSRFCLTELFVALAAFRPSIAGRRLRPFHGHAVGGRQVPIRTYTPRGIASALAPEFLITRWEALAAIVPPPWMNRWYSRLDGISREIERLDDRWRRGPLRSFGDHFLAEFRRT